MIANPMAAMIKGRLLLWLGKEPNKDQLASTSVLRIKVHSTSGLSSQAKPPIKPKDNTKGMSKQCIAQRKEAEKPMTSK
jgi:hypothetical protein